MSTNGTPEQPPGDVAQMIAGYILQDDHVQDFKPQRMSTHARWFSDARDEYLVVVMDPSSGAEAADYVMARALAWQGNRDLHLVVPDRLVEQVSTRLPWIGTEVRLWKSDGEPVPTKLRVSTVDRSWMRDVMQKYPPRAREQYNLREEHRPWLAGIDTDGLVRHRRGALQYHHHGLQVLRVSSTRAGMRVQAGVQYSTPMAGQLTRYDQTFQSAPDAGDLALINDAIRLAKESGSETNHMREHKMQSTLAGQGADLGLVTMLREYPAWRGPKPDGDPFDGRAGFIDFLGIDERGAFHVVECKIGHDPRVIMQALDYAIWVEANQVGLREELRRTEGIDLPEPVKEDQARPVPIHFVLGATEKDPAFGSYLPGQIEALSGDIKVTVHVTDDPESVPLRLTKLSKPQRWEPRPGLVAKPVLGPRWAEKLSEDLTK